jgi:hypothetical protein
MDAQTMTQTLAQIAVGVVFGLAAGLFHFATLRKVTALYLGGSLLHAVALQVLRLAALAALMVTLATLGMGALAAGALGVILGREIVLRRIRKAF